MTPAAIRTLRQSQKLTQTGFGALLGTRQATVSDWERGRYSPCGLALNSIVLLQHARALAADVSQHGPALAAWQKFVKDRQDL